MNFERSIVGGVFIAIIALFLTLGVADRRASATAPITFTVNSISDAVDDNLSDNVCHSGAGECTLRAAVQQANALLGADTIIVPGGVYNLALAGAGEDAAATGDLDITDDVTINGAGASSTIVDGGALDRVFHVPTASVKASISGVTVQNGSTPQLGGGITNSGTLTLTSSVVRGNSASSAGGVGNAGTLTVANSTVSNNSTPGNAGGVGNLGIVAITNSTISGNSGGVEGGGLAGPGTWTVSGTTITGNHAGGQGGGIAVPPSGSLTVTGSTVSDNTATLNGGGVAVGGTFSITGSTVSNNVSQANGGGIFAGGGIVTASTISGNSAALDGGGLFNAGTMTVSGSTISANSTAEFGGGVHNTGMLTLTNSTLSSNSARVCGGVCNFDMLVVIASTVSDNTVHGFTTAFGGAGLGQFAGSMTVIDSTITRNRALDADSGAGGGIGAASAVTVIGTTISENFAGGIGGGGIAHINGTLNVTNGTISGNSAAQFAGGIAGATDTITLNNVTITNNTADSDANGSGDGGGIASAGSLINLSNTIIAGNTDTGGQAPDCSVPLVSQGYNLIQNTAGCTILGDTPTNITGRQAGLGPLADNGGPTQTHALLAGSPAIDAGNPVTPGSADNACDPQDQRGVFRPQDGDGDGVARCDIGAFELGVFTSTLGKVTGGGCIPSASSGKASFGFVVKAVAAPSGPGQAISGALTYNDHAANVEISGVRFDRLTISGSHAVFTGTASVNGAAKRIRVTVDDLGEPGSSDTFGIEVLDGSYSNGPKTLSGGNIKIHK